MIKSSSMSSLNSVKDARPIGKVIAKASSHNSLYLEDITDMTNLNSKIEHVFPFVPISNASKCIISTTFPTEILNPKERAIETAVCLADPEGYVNDEHERGHEYNLPRNRGRRGKKEENKHIL